jgi:hypothetical protein
LQVEKDEFGTKSLNLRQSRSAVGGLADHIHVCKEFEALPQNPPGNGLIVDDERGNSAAFHLCKVYADLAGTRRRK